MSSQTVNALIDIVTRQVHATARSYQSLGPHFSHQDNFIKPSLVLQNLPAGLNPLEALGGFPVLCDYVASPDNCYIVDSYTAEETKGLTWDSYRPGPGRSKVVADFLAAEVVDAGSDAGQAPGTLIARHAPSLHGPGGTVEQRVKALATAMKGLPREGTTKMAGLVGEWLCEEMGW